LEENIMGEMVTVYSNGVAISAYLGQPSAGKGPGVAVIQKWGLVPHIKSIVDQFAAAEFLACCSQPRGYYFARLRRWD
jgi:carboxymethylenebutenolidase